MSTPLNIGTLPQGFCPATYQDMLNGYGAALSVDIPSASGISISATKPADTSNVWFQIDSLGRFIRTYIFGQGSWLSAHPMQPGFCVWWFSALPDFTTFDGGDASAVGAAAGPMWQQAKDGNGTTIAAKFIVSAGTLPSATVLSIGGTGGEETHVLTAAEGAQDPTHRHVTGRFAAISGGGVDDVYLIKSAVTAPIELAHRCAGGNSLSEATLDTLSGVVVQTSQVLPAPSANLGHNTLPPYVVGYLIQRTARIFYSIV